jgi:putative transposase
MKALAARATRYRNRLEGRSGTLWESRYKSSVVQRDDYLLACCRYIELNPVRARMVGRPEDYRWSSFRARMGDVQEGGWLDLDPCFLGLSAEPGECRDRYRDFVNAMIPDDETLLIRSALQRGQLTGSARFALEMEQVIGRRVATRGQGRPHRDK